MGHRLQGKALIMDEKGLNNAVAIAKTHNGLFEVAQASLVIDTYDTKDYKVPCMRLATFDVYHERLESKEIPDVRGLGKELLALTIRAMVTEHVLSLDHVILTEVSGGRKNESLFADWSRDQLAVYLTSLHFSDLTLSDMETETTIELLDLARIGHANQRLVRYYETFGFIVRTNVFPSLTQMTATVGTIIKGLY